MKTYQWNVKEKHKLLTKIIIRTIELKSIHLLTADTGWENRILNMYIYKNKDKLF